MNQLQKIIVPILRAVAVSADSSINEIGSFADSGLAGWIEKSFEARRSPVLPRMQGLKFFRPEAMAVPRGWFLKLNITHRTIPFLPLSIKFVVHYPEATDNPEICRYNHS